MNVYRLETDFAYVDAVGEPGDLVDAILSALDAGGLLGTTAFLDKTKHAFTITSIMDAVSVEAAFVAFQEALRGAVAPYAGQTSMRQTRGELVAA